MKMLVVYQKLGLHRFLGHLDLQRAMQRALRRSGLPVCYSQGFNPHLLLSFAAPLSVGIQGEREVMELPLGEPVAEQDFLRRLNAALPEGLKALQARLLGDDAAPAMARLEAAVYTIVPREAVPELLAAVPGFLAQTAIPCLRKTKSGERMDDLRPLVYNLLVKQGALHAVLAISERGTARPDQLLASLAAFAGVSPPRCAITRAALLDGRMAPLEDP